MAERDTRGQSGSVDSRATEGSGPLSLQATSAVTRTVLPSDLTGALATVSDDDLEQLLAAVTAELKRRNARSDGNTGPPAKRPLAQAPSKVRPPAETAPQALPQAKINAIRAAIKAGVKPTMVARQFGVSLAAIRQALK